MGIKKDKKSSIIKSSHFLNSDQGNQEKEKVLLTPNMRDLFMKDEPKIKPVFGG